MYIVYIYRLDGMMMVLQDVQLVEQCVAQGNSSEDPSISVYNKAEANSYTCIYNKAEANSYTRI